jgi:hypothetical protein
MKTNALGQGGILKAGMGMVADPNPATRIAARAYSVFEIYRSNDGIAVTGLRT